MRKKLQCGWKYDGEFFTFVGDMSREGDKENLENEVVGELFKSS